MLASTDTFFLLLFTECEDDDEEEEDEDAEVVYRERAPLKRQNEVHRGAKSRMSSTSSGSSDTSGAGEETPVIQSDDEEVHVDTLLLTSAPQTRDEETEEEDEEERGLARAGRGVWHPSFWVSTFATLSFGENLSMVDLAVIQCVLSLYISFPEYLLTTLYVCGDPSDMCNLAIYINESYHSHALTCPGRDDFQFQVWFLSSSPLFMFF